jgi:hypothetical protein
VAALPRGAQIEVDCILFLKARSRRSGDSAIHADVLSRDVRGAPCDARKAMVPAISSLDIDMAPAAGMAVRFRAL